MKYVMHYCIGAAGWLTICLIGVSLGHRLPAAFVLAPLWLPFAVAGMLLAFMCLAVLALLGTGWAMSRAVEWRARRANGRFRG